MVMLASLALSVLLLAGPGPHPPPFDEQILAPPARSDLPSATPSPVPVQAGVWPLRPPQLVAGFDPPASTWAAGHRGVDLGGIPGQQVRAALGGTVTFAGTIAGRGVVVVSHGARRTTYEPVSAWVDAGDPISTDDVLGVLAPGPTHCAPSACLHWGLLEGDTYLDPLSLLGVRRVQLLPILED